MVFCDDSTWSVGGSGDNAVDDDGMEGSDIDMEDEVEDYVDSEGDGDEDDDDDIVREMRSGEVDDSDGSDDDEDDDEDNDDNDDLTASSEEQDDESSEDEDIFAASPSYGSKRGRGGSKSGQKKRQR